MNKTKNRSVKTKTPKDFKTCFVSKQTGPRSSMLRFVADEGGVIYFDVLEKLPGRGLWLMPDRQIVCKAIEKQGKKARLLFSWDDFDRCRKIPANVQAVVGDTYDKYIGTPYVDIPDPWGCHENYAEHFKAEFTDFNLTKCVWEPHDGQQPDNE